MRSLLGLVTVMATCVMATLGTASTTYAQTMNFSVYQNATYGNNRIYGLNSVIDNGSCGHTGFQMTSYLVSPSGRSASSTGGTSATASLAFNDEYGDWRTNGNGSALCGCSGFRVGFGGGALFRARKLALYSAAYKLADKAASKWTKVTACPTHICQDPETYEAVSQTAYDESIEKKVPLYLSRPGSRIRLEFLNGGAWVEYCRWVSSTQKAGLYSCFYTVL